MNRVEGEKEIKSNKFMSEVRPNKFSKMKEEIQREIECINNPKFDTNSHVMPFSSLYCKYMFPNNILYYSNIVTIPTPKICKSYFIYPDIFL